MPRTGLVKQPLGALIWFCALMAVAVPITLAALSPLLAWRAPIYIAAGFAGVIALAILLFQPLFAARSLTGLFPMRARTLHRAGGIVLVLAVVVHVLALWVTSPPDVIDALFFASPTPFSAWGVVAMWATFASALIAALRRRIRVRAQTWRIAHKCLAVVIVTGTIVHTLLIDGTMEPISKAVLCALVAAATLKALSTR